MTYTAELLPLNAPDYRLINGHCSQPGCEHWATEHLYDEQQKQVPGKLCATCALGALREYRTKLKMYWRTRTIKLYHVGRVLFDTREHAEAYAARKNKEHQE